MPFLPLKIIFYLSNSFKLFTSLSIVDAKYRKSFLQCLISMSRQTAVTKWSFTCRKKTLLKMLEQN